MTTPQPVRPQPDELDYIANRLANGTMPGNARYIFSKTDWAEFKAAINRLLIQERTDEVEDALRLVESGTEYQDIRSDLMDRLKALKSEGKDD